MTEKPILMSPPMAIASLDETKTQTRRVVKNPDYFGCFTGDCPHWNESDCRAAIAQFVKTECPYGTIGDRLWVREEHYRFGHWEKVTGTKARTRTGRQKWKFVADHDEVLFDAPESFRRGRHHKDPETPAWHKRLARFMPKKFFRTRLEITDVRVERLQEISRDDAIAEGVFLNENDWWDAGNGLRGENTPEWAYANLWESINGPGSWQQNPYVWVITFKRIKP